MMDTHEIISLIQDKFGQVMFTHVYSVRGECGQTLSVTESVGSGLGDDYEMTQFSRWAVGVLQGVKRDQGGSVCDSEITN